MLTNKEIINKRISTVLEDFNFSTAGLNGSLENYPLTSYLLDSLLIRLTGAQEQKLKSITWELGSVDPIFRRKLLRDLSLGEYSSYEAKQTIFQSLISSMEKLKIDFLITDNEKNEIIDYLHDSMDEFLSGNALSQLVFRDYRFYIDSRKSRFKSDQFFMPTKKGYLLFEGGLVELYESLYVKRNRIAHNVASSAHVSPPLEELATVKKNPENYFMWFSVLILIDSIFILLFDKLLKGVESDPWMN